MSPAQMRPGKTPACCRWARPQRRPAVTQALPELTTWFIRKLLAGWLVFQRGLNPLQKCDLSGEDLVSGHIVLVAEELQRRARNCRKLPIPRPAGPQRRVRVVGFDLFPRALLAACTQVLGQRAHSTESQPRVQGVLPTGAQRV